jgi:hypothetical protein
MYIKARAIATGTITKHARALSCDIRQKVNQPAVL